MVAIELCSLPMCLSTGKEIFVNTGNFGAVRESIQLDWSFGKQKKRAAPLPDTVNMLSFLAGNLKWLCHT